MTSEEIPYRKRTLRNSLSAGLGNGWTALLALASTPVLLRSLGLEQYGLWAFLLTFSATAGWLSLLDLGLGVAAGREVAVRLGRARNRPVEEARLDEAISTTLVLFPLLGAVTALIVYFTGPVVLPAVFDLDAGRVSSFETAIRWFALWTFADFVAAGARSCLEGLQRITVARFADGVKRTFTVAGAVIAAAVTEDIAWTTRWASAGAVVGTLVMLLAQSRVRPIRFGVPSASSARAMVRYGFTVATLRPLGVIHRSMDRIIVAILLGPDAVAAVDVVTQLQTGGEAVLGATSQAVTTGSAYVGEDPQGDRLRTLVIDGGRYVFAATIPVVIGIALLAGPGLRIWVGPDVVSPVVVAVAIAYVGLTAPIQVSSNMLLGVGEAGAIRRAAVVAVLVNLVLTVTLVEVWGIIGAFIASLFSAAIVVPMIAEPASRIVGVGRWDLVTRSVRPVVIPSLVLSAIVGGVVLLPIGDAPTLAAGVVLGGVGYLAAAARLSFSRAEIHEIRGLLRP